MKHVESPDTLKILKTLVSRMEIDASPSVQPTVEEAVASFLAAKAKTIKPITVRNYRRHLDHWRKKFGACRVNELSLDAIADDAAARGWSDTNTANYLATIEACLKHAGHPLAFLKPGRESAGADSVVPDDVYKKCLRYTTGDFQQFIRFLWNTGCRPAEASKLTAEAIDLAAGVARLKYHKTRLRTGKVRLLYLGPEAMEVIKEQLVLHPAGYLFRGMRGVPYSLQAIVMRFVRLSAKVGHPVCAYNFRHTFATRALSKGIPDTHVAALMGHANTVMVHRHYGHVNQNSRLLRDVAAAAESA